MTKLGVRKAHLVLHDFGGPWGLAWALANSRALASLTLITTVDAQGRVNAAAFGTCTRVCHDPMYIAFTCSAGKDTTNNVLATGEFVVNVVPFEQPLLDKVPVCGLPFKPGENELKKAGLTAIPSRVLRPPRIGPGV